MGGCMGIKVLVTFPFGRGSNGIIYGMGDVGAGPFRAIGMSDHGTWGSRGSRGG